MHVNCQCNPQIYFSMLERKNLVNGEKSNTKLEHTLMKKTNIKFYKKKAMKSIRFKHDLKKHFDSKSITIHIISC